MKMGAKSALVCVLTGLISGAPQSWYEHISPGFRFHWQEPNKVCEAILVYYSSLDEILREKE